MEDDDFLDRIQQIVCLNDDFINTKIMEKSDHSTASTNNTDIFILEANESHYGDIENSTYLEHSNVDASFTVLNAPPSAFFKRKINTKDRLSSDEIDESTEVLMVIKAEDRNPHLKSGISGTDSDVEVLMSEEIVDSDWSGGGDDLQKRKSCRKKVKNDDVTKTDDSIQIKSFETNEEDVSGSIKHQSSTDQDISSVEDFSGGSLMGAYDKLPKKDLVNIIREQATRIESLESQLNRCRAIQQTFFDYVAELRHQLEDVNPDRVVE